MDSMVLAGILPCVIVCLSDEWMNEWINQLTIAVAEMMGKRDGQFVAATKPFGWRIWGGVTVLGIQQMQSNVGLWLAENEKISILLSLQLRQDILSLRGMKGIKVSLGIPLR